MSMLSSLHQVLIYLNNFQAFQKVCSGLEGTVRNIAQAAPWSLWQQLQIWWSGLFALYVQTFPQDGEIEATMSTWFNLPRSCYLEQPNWFIDLILQTHTYEIHDTLRSRVFSNDTKCWIICKLKQKTYSSLNVYILDLLTKLGIHQHDNFKIKKHNFENNAHPFF